MLNDFNILIILLFPMLMAGLSQLMPSAGSSLRLVLVGTLATSAITARTVWLAFHSGPLLSAGKWLMIDALSAYHLFVLMAVYSLCAAYSVIYFSGEEKSGSVTRKDIRRYSALWFASLAAMTLVLISNNLGIMWVGIEASTLSTAFLICTHATPKALEAMWKYLIMCSVGVALAFIGCLFVAASAAQSAIPDTDKLLWTCLMQSAGALNPTMIKAGFIFIVIGYGTKAGLAPMHNWLPDAHSQAPAPVSAIFSGFLLNTALYCILRCLPLAEAVTGNSGWAPEILVVIGLISVIVSAVFILGQSDLKRMLAYCSVEHIGLIAIGAGIGGLGAVAAMFHILNHSLSKVLAFFCAGVLGQKFGTNDMRRISGSLKLYPVWGAGLTGSILALLGVVPFAVFLSEFWLIKAAIMKHDYWTTGLLLFSLALIFIGMVRHLFTMVWGDAGDSKADDAKPSVLAWIIVIVPLALLALLCLWIPVPLFKAIVSAAQIIGGGL